ncbi:hypothetical protein F3K50_07980 [Pseudomonas marginalis]|nr:hypothetical protein F3K50_07980 [Pseudomonas marginalis]
MTLLRFISLLFVFIGVLASCAVAVGLLVLMLRFWPALLIVILTITLFGGLLKNIGIRITART